MPPPVGASEAVRPLPIPKKRTVPEHAPLVALIAGSLVAIVLIIALLMHKIERDNAREAAMTSTAAADSRETAAPTPSPSNVQLVPSADNAGTGPDQPLTSAPAAPSNGALANPYARDDATALSQSAYTQLAQVARRTESQPSSDEPQLVDPRSITSGRFSGRAPRRLTGSVQPASSTEPVLDRTEPIAIYQPVPAIHVEGGATAHLLLTVGADGRVTDVDVSRGLAGETARLVDAVQEWRFRPATERGRPVASRFSVDITFHGNE
jgi:TonB family protein